MDQPDAAKMVYNRIKQSEPEHITRKIIAYIWLQKDGAGEMIRLALGPDILIQSVIHNAKINLGIDSIPLISPPLLPSLPFTPLSQPFPSQRLTARGGIAYTDQLLEFKYPNPPQFVCPSEFLPKVCHYFNKGFCRHGTNCRYMHGTSGYVQGFDKVGNEDHQIIAPGSLEKLEMEITEILKSRRGNPISIASLPMIYYEKYGRNLQAEGYLTESQRHGKAGYNLTKLLARLRNNIRLIDRPHGQHSVILAEDAPKYIGPRWERNDPGPIVSGSRQIYLTFPAESTFTEEEVSDYFSTFGPVQDVRIPCQQKRMFGFVTFDSADTVKIILSQGNPHYVCGARVLVKPYREKSKLVERKQSEKLENLIYISGGVDMDAEQARLEYSRMIRQKLIDEQEEELELQRMHLTKLQLAPSPSPSQSYYGYSIDDIKLSQDHHSKFPPYQQFNYPFDVLKNGEDNIKRVGPNYFEQNNQGLNLPESPFATTISTGISTAAHQPHL